MGEHIQELDLNPQDFAEWRYPGRTLRDGRVTGIMPYSNQITYFNGSRTHVEGMNVRNHLTAFRFVLTH